MARNITKYETATSLDGLNIVGFDEAANKTLKIPSGLFGTGGGGNIKTETVYNGNGEDVWIINEKFKDESAIFFFIVEYYPWAYGRDDEPVEVFMAPFTYEAAHEDNYNYATFSTQLGETVILNVVVNERSDGYLSFSMSNESRIKRIRMIYIPQEVKA